MATDATGATAAYQHVIRSGLSSMLNSTLQHQLLYGSQGPVMAYVQAEMLSCSSLQVPALQRPYGPAPSPVPAFLPQTAFEDSWWPGDKLTHEAGVPATAPHDAQPGEGANRHTYSSICTAACKHSEAACSSGPFAEIAIGSSSGPGPCGGGQPHSIKPQGSGAEKPLVVDQTTPESACTIPDCHPQETPQGGSDAALELLRKKGRKAQTQSRLKRTVGQRQPGQQM